MRLGVPAYYLRPCARILESWAVTNQRCVCPEESCSLKRDFQDPRESGEATFFSKVEVSRPGCGYPTKVFLGYAMGSLMILGVQLRN